MPIRKSAGAVVFRRQRGEIFYLLLLGGNKHWGFPKGEIEKGESVMEAAKREIKEEAGLSNLKFINGFKEWIKFFYKRGGKNIFKVVTYLLAETKETEVSISFEHEDFAWLTFEEAIKRLEFENAKNILRKANDFIRKEVISAG